MFRPWSQDPRPVWRVQATCWTPEPTDRDDHALLLRTLAATGHVRAPTLETGHGRVTLTMLVHAYSHEAAEHIAGRVAQVAYHTAGLGHLGMSITCTAESHLTHDVPVA